MKFTFEDNKTETFSLIGGKYAISVAGDFGGGTLTFKHTPDDGANFVDFPTAFSKTAAEGVVLEWSGRVQLELSGATDPDLNVDINPIHERYTNR